MAFMNPSSLIFHEIKSFFLKIQHRIRHMKFLKYMVSYSSEFGRKLSGLR